MKSGTKVTTARDGAIKIWGVRFTFAAGLSEKSCLPFGRVEKLRLCHRHTAPVHNSWLGWSRIPLACLLECMRFNFEAGAGGGRVVHLLLDFTRTLLITHLASQQQRKLHLRGSTCGGFLLVNCLANENRWRFGNLFYPPAHFQKKN
jgi:hypothetical protein